MAKSSASSFFEKGNYGINGRVVTMKLESEILEDATIYIQDGVIQEIVTSGAPIPDTLKDLPVIKSRGTIFPGLIELHNHLSYNCLPLWPVPKKFCNRSQWAGIPLYQQLISGPMSILGKTPEYASAIVRYVECKCLVAGVTTTQGIMLFSNAGIKKFYQGVVRNVEDGSDPRLPAVDAHIPDIAARDAAHFLKQLSKSSCLLLHLSEGADSSAHKHFEALKINDDTWAITSALAGIHCVALKREDFDLMKNKGASMVWSPMSNLMLYGTTADMIAAKASGIVIGIGSDWSPSGSKNLLGELKAAKLYSDQNGHLFSDYELISMATVNAAKIIKWDQYIGSIEKEKLADLLILEGQNDDPYRQLLHVSEKDIRLVVINGKARHGDKALMKQFGQGTEEIKIGTSKKLLNLADEASNSVVNQLKLSDAARKLKTGLKDLKMVARARPMLKELITSDHERISVPAEPVSTKEMEASFVLILDHNEEEGESLRLHIPVNGEMTVPQAKAQLKPEDLPSIKLDPLCVNNDKSYFKNIENALNLPDYIKTGLKNFYS